MQNKQVKVIQPKPSFDLSGMPSKQLKKRVCAYVRVSTDNEEQKTSYVAQTEEYTSRIQSNPEWIFCGIYADEGISGTSTKHRKQFNEMIASAKRGEIDLVITKSISRFARNTVDCLNHIREMRSINVEIYFEKENIYSSDPKVDFLLTIMSSIAQEEARNVSENVKWNVRSRFNNGVPIVNHKRFLGYTKDKKGGNLIIEPSEAEIIKLIFQMYTSGVGPKKIANHLESMGVLTGSGSKIWGLSSINVILKNEKYTGDLIQQKTITVDYLTHRKIKNKDIAPKYQVENSHEAIIDKETFQLAQKIREDRAKVKIGKDKNMSKYNSTYPFSAFIICSECGRTLKRRYWNYGTPAQRVMQQCGGYIHGKDNCKAKATYQELLEGSTIQMLNEVFLQNNEIIPKIKKIIKSTIKTTDIDIRIEKLKIQNDKIEKMIANLIDIQVKNPNLSEYDFNTKYQNLTFQMKTNQDEIQTLESEFLHNYDTRSRLASIETSLNQIDKPLTELDGDVLRSFIYKMISIKPDEIVFCVAGTKNYGDEEFKEKRHQFSALVPIADGVYHSQKYNKDMNYRVVVI